MKSIIIELDYYRKQLKKIDEELQTLPAGRLVKRGKLYCHSIDRKEVGITYDTELIAKLSRKKYLLNLKKRLDKYVFILSQCERRLKPIAIPTEIIRSLTPTYQGQPASHFFHPSTSNWLAEHYQTNPFPPDGQTYTTENGIVVRSKSEFIIATILERYNIPYRYDAALCLGGQIKYPDFIILNPYNGKTIIWEHFGGLDFPKYKNKMNEKMVLYKNAGYVPFETLIYTFECDIDIHNIQDLIENIILKP